MARLLRSSRRLRWSVTLATLLLGFLAFMPAPQAEPVTLIRNNGSSANRVDLVILGDGYTQAEIDSGKYANDVEAFVQGMFAQEPYLEYQNYFNVARIDVVSNESGADKPLSGIFKDTAFDATYYCNSIQRLICVNTGKVNTVLTNSGITGNARDTVLVIVNDTEYGGSGGSIAVASINSAVVELVLHELGHSFGFLADEYGGPPPPSCQLSEPSNANATRQTNPALVKWNAWVDPGVPLPTPGTTNGVPGYYEGAVYCDTGAYRPTYNSKMRSLNQPFHQINVEQHVKRIYNFVSPIDGSSPAGTVIATGTSQDFSVSIPQPFTHTLDVVWRLDGNFQVSGTQFTASGLTSGPHTVTAEVADVTAMVRNDPAGLLTEVRTWTVNVTIPGPTITVHPVDQRIVEGSSATFTADSTGPTTSTWQWQVSADGGVIWADLVNVAPYSGVTTATLTVTNAPATLNGRRYRAVATDSNGSTATNSAVLTVYAAGATLLQNGDFSAGGTGWLVFEEPDIVWNIVGGVMQFFRESPTSTASGQAVVYQHSGVSLGAGTPLAASFDLGNSSTVRKRLTVVILDSNFSDLHVCTFYLAAGAPLRTYQMKTHSNQAWANAAIYFYTASAGSNGGNYLLDNVSLRYEPAVSTTRTDCVDPTAPVAPGGAAGPNLLTNGDFGTGLAPWGTFGAITWQITAGVFEFFKPAAPQGTPAGVVLQGTGQAMPVNQILTATFQLGNSSLVRRRVTVLLHDADFSDLVACTFWLAPSQPLGTYSIRMFATKAWGNAMLSVYSATTGPHQWILFDNAVLQRTPAATALGTECFEPIGPAAEMKGVVPRSVGNVGDAPVDPVPDVFHRSRYDPFLLDLRAATGARLTFASWLSSDTSPAEVQVSVDGVTWLTAAVAPASDDWTRMSVDLSAFAGHLVGIRFVFDGRPPDMWRIGSLVFQIGR